MKLLLVMMVCAVAAAAPEVNKVETLQLDSFLNETPEIDALVRQLFAYIHFVIANGSVIFGIPPLNPLELDHYHLVIPAGLVNLDLELKNIRMVGIDAFEIHTSILNLRDMTFDLDISVPTLDISADNYNLSGDLFTAIPLYGDGEARFLVEGFRFRAKLFLKQSDDGKSVLIEKVESSSFVIPTIKSELTGAIGGGDIDAIVNAMIEDVILDYINRFQGAIALLTWSTIVSILNPVLADLPTWRIIEPLIPS